MSDFDPTKHYRAKEVAEITGMTERQVRAACKRGAIKGAYRAQPTGQSPWIAKGDALQEWFDTCRGLKRAGV
jgi:hypothetical protein